MVTVPEVVETIIRKSPFLDEALSLRILNHSAVARMIKPDVEQELMKKVRIGAVVMALNRLSRRIVKRARRQKSVFRRAPELTVRSNLVELTYANSENMSIRQKKLLDQHSGKSSYVLTFTQGINETTIVASRELREKIQVHFKDERLIDKIDNLSTVSVLLPRNTAMIPGVYSYILKALAWEGINVVEVVSTLNELMIVLEDKNIQQAFLVIKRLF